MATKIRRVAWDSCVFIDCLERREGRIEFIEPMVREGEAGKLAIVCSTLAIAETIHINNMGEEKERNAITQFFRNDYVHIYAADETVAGIARDIRRVSKVRSEDAIHLATAIHMECDALLTNDGDTADGKPKKLPPPQNLW